MTGEPGAGASWLCRRAAAETAGARVLTIRGATGESGLAGAGLHDLLTALGPKPLARLPTPQLAATAALLDGGAPAASHPLAVPVACRAVLAAAAAEHPLVLLVDDADRLDALTVAALRFCARRLADLRALMLVAMRSDQAAAWPPAVERISVDGLDEGEAGAVLRAHAHGPVEASVARRLTALTGGNAAALRRAATTLAPAQLAGDEPLPASPPVPAEIVSAWALRLEGLPATTRQALVFTAVAETAPTRVALGGLAELDLGPAALDPAAQRGLVRLVDDAPRPLDRLAAAAVTRAAPPSLAATAHRALAAAWTAAGVADEAVLQLATAPVLTGPGASAELLSAGRAARDVGAHGPAATAFRSAAARTLDPDERSQLLLDAATELTHDGRLEDLLALVDELGDQVADAAVRTERELLRAFALTWLGAEAEAADRLHDEVARLEAAGLRNGDVTRAVRLLTTTALVRSNLGAVESGRALAERAAELARSEDGEAVAIAQRTLSLHRVLAGLGRAAAPLARNEDGGGAMLPPLHRTHASLGALAMWLDDHAAAAEALDDEIAAARGAHATCELSALLALSAELAFRTGDWPAARARAEDALAAARDVGGAAHHADTELARLDAVCGEEAAARERARHTRERTGGLPRLRATAALGLLELSCGAAENAADLLEAAQVEARAAGLGEPSVVPYAADLVEAQVRAGRDAEARCSLAAILPAAAEPGRDWAAAAAWRCRGMLARAGDVDAAFARAERHAEGLPSSFERSRLELCHGERLRRDGRRVESRRHLRAALEGFEALDAAPWRERAMRELRASGTRPPRARAAVGEPLTPQEKEVAQLVADGMTNREVAASLFISTKTVEYHLGHVFRKLGVRSRTQLALRIAEPQHTACE